MAYNLIVLTKKWGHNFTGATLATQHLIKKWIQDFDGIEVYTLELGEYEKYENLVVRRYESESKLKRALKNRKENSKNEILYGYSDDHLGYILGRLNIAYIHTYHGNWPDARFINLEFFLKSFYFMPLYKRTLSSADCVVNVSKYMEEYTKRYNNSSVLIHNGVDLKKDSSEAKYENAYLMVGNVDRRKYGYAIQLAKNILENDSDIEIHIYGRLLDRKIASELKRLPNVTLKGHCSDIPYKSYRGFINTSRIENLSISVCEAIYNEIPVFCFEVGGLPEVVINNRTGFVVARYDVRSMAKKILEYERYNQVVTDKSVLDDFDWAKAADRYLELIKSYSKRG